MNQAHTEAALTQVRSDIRQLIKGADAEAAWNRLGMLAILFIVACEQANGVGYDRPPLDDPIDWWLVYLLERELTAIRRAKRKSQETIREHIGHSSRSLARWKELDAVIEEEYESLIAQAISQYRKDGAASLLSLTLQGSEESLASGRRILDWLEHLDMKTSDGRRCGADLFEHAVHIALSRHGAHLGEYVTPEPVAKLMLELADIAPGQSVYDPCAGLGEILIGAGRRLGNIDTVASLPSAPRMNIYGAEISLMACCVTRCRLLLNGFDGISLKNDDTLERPLPGDRAETGFDRIVAAPPWGSDEQHEQFPFPTARAEELFLQHVMAYLRPGGRAVVALPERTLVHAEASALRKELLSRYRVDGVIALPPGALEPCTSRSTSLIVFSRARPRKRVRFVTVSPTAWQELSSSGGRSTSGWVLEISRILADDRDLQGELVALGVQSWAAPVDDILLHGSELIAKKSGNEVLDAELSRLVDADRSLQVRSLDEIADIGRGFHRSEDGNTLRDTVLVPTDVTHSGLGPPSGGIEVDDLLTVHPSKFLRDGDLIVPMSETIGNVGVVEDIKQTSGWFGGGVLADERIAVVRPHDGIRPEFLIALLRSPGYWFWLTGYAKGTPLPALSTEVLSTLKVPVPSLSVQAAVLEELTEPHGDALAVLHRLLSGAARHPVTLWLEGPFAANLAAGGPTTGAGGLDTLAKFAAEIGSIALLSAAPMAVDRSIGRWLEAARRAGAALEDVGSVPAGSGRLVILEFAAVKLREAVAAIERTDQTIGERLRSVTWALVGLIEDEVHELQRRSSLEVVAEAAEVQAGVADELRLQVINSSPVPLRKVRVSARQADQTVAHEGEVSYLAEGQRHEIPVVVRARDDTKPLQIDVAWQARRLDATQVRGETQVSVLVRSAGEAVAGDLGVSPYIVGNPVDRDEMFFGRDGIMDQIRRHIGGDRANVILLEGNRRTGKTSILKQLEREDALPGWVPVYCSFQDLDSMATPDVFRLLAKQTGWALADAGIETWIPDQPAPVAGKPLRLAFLVAVRAAFSNHHPYETLALYLSGAVEAVKPRRILFMLDEFDKLQEGIDRGETSSQVPENIRHLLQHQPGLGAIITGSRRLKRLREEYWSALFGFGHRIGVSALPEEDARRLVTEPVAPRIRYLPQARDRLVALCARHPFLIQSLCSRVFDLAAAGGERTITGDVVERAATEMVRDNEHFQTLWGYAGSERRRLILELSHRLEDSADAVNLDLIAMKIAEHGVPVRDDKTLADDVTELRELELLEIDESYRGGTYRLSIPLMAKWMRLNVDFKDLVKRARREARRDG